MVRFGRFRHRGLWLRRGAVQPFGHPHGDMRAGQHGPGAQAR
ncbi:Uncharacterised protein [Bordetella pertussis]|nr:Uncharacterised protein [Bordetella pertussis]